MSRRLDTGAATSLVLAAVLACAWVVLGAGSAQALPRSLPLQVSFTDLQPGQTRSTSWPVQIPTRARITQAMLRQDGPGGVRWTARLCPVSGAACLDVMTAAVGTSITAGDYLLTVGLTVVDLQPGQSQSLEGRYTLVEDDDGVLADTGGDGPNGGLASTGLSVLPLGVTALALAALGVLLVVLARRRHEEQASDPPAEGSP
ncbi:MAG TPA: hypothetical protein VGC04_05040 [Cellulomonas sp.]